MIFTPLTPLGAAGSELTLARHDDGRSRGRRHDGASHVLAC